MLCGAVLCGGASRRMGTDKALLPVDGVAMAVRVATALRAAGCDPVVAIGGDVEALAALGLHVVPDEFPGEGPLGGVVTALDHFARAAAVAIVACDLPHLTAGSVAALVAALRGSPDHQVDVAMAAADRAQPACAVWSPRVGGMMRASFHAGERRLTAALDSIDTVVVTVDPQDLANVNTPRDLSQ